MTLHKSVYSVKMYSVPFSCSENCDEAEEILKNVPLSCVLSQCVPFPTANPPVSNYSAHEHLVMQFSKCRSLRVILKRSIRCLASGDDLELRCAAEFCLSGLESVHSKCKVCYDDESNSGMPLTATGYWCI